jgi:hypothetical protein
MLLSSIVHAQAAPSQLLSAASESDQVSGTLVDGGDRLSAATPQLATVLAQALARWANLGVTIAAPQIVVTDLPGNMLGQAMDHAIYLDCDAAGHGWFVDPTPALDEEFARLGDGGQFHAVDPQAVDRMDLLTVIEHELGHLAGPSGLAASVTSLMSGTLPNGVRRLPIANEVDAVFAS